MGVVADYAQPSDGSRTESADASARPDDAAGSDADNGDAKLLETAKARYKLAVDAWQENRELAAADDKFASGEQWDSSVANERKADGRPCLVVNRIQQSLQQLTNDQRQNRPSIKVHPVDDKADVDTAKTIQGLIRHIEYNSSADTAYDTAFDQAARGGWGWIRVVTDYCHPESFDQEILIKRIRSRFAVAFDPASQEPDGSDAAYAFVEDVIPRSDFEAQYPKAKLSQPNEWDTLKQEDGDWVSAAGARLVDYLYKDTREDTLLLLSNNTSVLKSELTDEMRAAMAAAGTSIARERTTHIPVIKCCKFNGCEILEKTEWLGRYIPIIPVYGTESIVDGKRVLSGLVRPAQDPQRMYNYMVSAEAESIGLAPKAPFIGYAGQFAGREVQWREANRRNYAYLEVNPVMVNGQPAPLPQRNAFEPAVQAISQARMLAADDVKAATGIYDASLGAKSNETSGIAIQRRNVQAQTANFHFVDNLTRSMRHLGRILVDLIPKVYDTKRTARIIGDDGEQKVVTLNNVADPNNPNQPLYALDAGQYDVTVDVGPSFASKRQEAAASMADLTRSYPQIMQIAGDLLVKNLDWPGASELAERMKKTIPPNLLTDDKNGPPVPPQVKAQLDQQGQMVEKLSQALHAAHDTIDQKKVELESKERIEMAKIQAQIEIAMAQMGSKEAITVLTQEIGAIQHRLDLLHMSAPMGQDGMQPPAPGPQAPPQDQAPMPTAGGSPAESEAGAGTPMPTGGASPGQPEQGPAPQ